MCKRASFAWLQRSAVSAAPLVLCVAGAVALWSIFHPGIFTPDSVDQVAQARSGKLNNVFPPVMSIALRGCMKVGADVDVLVLLQACSTVAALWLLAKNLIWSWRPQSRGTVAAWGATGVVAALLAPFSPLAFYVVTFWKDVWVLDAFLWIGALASWMGRNRAAGGLMWWSVFAAMGAAMLLVVLARHNAVCVLPAFAALAVWALRTRRVRRPWLWVAVGTVALAVAPKAVERLWSVHDGRPLVHIAALDLIGMCVLDPAIRAELPLTDQCLVEGYRERYEIADVSPIVYTPPFIADPAYFADPDALFGEYRRAIVAHPWDFVRVKWAAFVRLLGFESTIHFFANDIYPNDLGLAQSRRGADLRLALSFRTYASLLTPWRRWTVGVHGVWLIVAVLLFAGSLVRRRSDSGAAVPAARLLAYPLLYDASYLAAIPMPDYRFMYPATVVVQVYCLAGLVGFVSSRCGRREIGPGAGSGVATT